MQWPYFHKRTVLIKLKATAFSRLKKGVILCANKRIFKLVMRQGQTETDAAQIRLLTVFKRVSVKPSVVLFVFVFDILGHC